MKKGYVILIIGVMTSIIGLAVNEDMFQYKFELLSFGVVLSAIGLGLLYKKRID